MGYKTITKLLAEKVTGLKSSYACEVSMLRKAHIQARLKCCGQMRPKLSVWRRKNARTLLKMKSNTNITLLL